MLLWLTKLKKGQIPSISFSKSNNESVLFYFSFLTELLFFETFLFGSARVLRQTKWVRLQDVLSGQVGLRAVIL